MGNGESQERGMPAHAMIGKGVFCFIAGTLLSFFIVVLWPEMGLLWGLDFALWDGLKTLLVVVLSGVVLHLILSRRVLVPMFSFVFGASASCLLWVCLFTLRVSRTTIVDGAAQEEVVSGLELMVLLLNIEPWVYCSFLLLMVCSIKALRCFLMKK